MQLSMKLAALRLVLITIIIHSMNCYGQGSGNELNVATWVHRRSTDFYQLRKDESHTVCDKDSTFMVKERQCIKNEDIFNGNDISHLCICCIHDS